MRTMQRWMDHSPFTDPGKAASALAVIRLDDQAMLLAVQGLLIHGGALEYYGLPALGFSRETIPAGDRLLAIQAADPRPLNRERAPADRSMGTCRDYALLLCSIMRTHGTPARVRCGFASYLNGAPWEDHWVCEAWTGERWRRLDAQLDHVLQRSLGIDLDPADIPEEFFLTADEAWRRCRVSEIEAESLGHGDMRGLWFACVNLVRDRLALADQITSGWDSWREAAAAPGPNEAMLDMADALAADEDAAAQAIRPWWI